MGDVGLISRRDVPAADELGTRGVEPMDRMTKNENRPARVELFHAFSVKTTLMAIRGLRPRL